MSDKKNQKEFARALGVSPSYVCRLVKRGVITLDEQGLVDVAAATLAVESSRHGSYGRRSQAPSTPVSSAAASDLPGDHPLDRDQKFQQVLDGTLNISDVKHVEIRKWLDFEKAVEQKIENEKERRRLLDADEVQKIAFQTYRDVRDGILNFPDRLSSALAGKTRQRFREKLAPDLLVQVEAALTDEDWQEIVYNVLNHEVQEVLNGLSNPMAAAG